VTWLEQWRALAARIDGLIRAGEFLALLFKVHPADRSRVVAQAIAPELKEITNELRELGRSHASELPPKAFAALERYTEQGWENQLGNAGDRGEIEIQVLAPLVAFRSEFEYLIRDNEIEGRNLTELAFEHLRRQIVELLFSLHRALKCLFPNRVNRLLPQVPASKRYPIPALFEPIKLIHVDWRNRNLVFKLNRQPERGWVERFKSPTEGFSFTSHGHPHNFNFEGDEARIPADENEAQPFVDSFRLYIEMANRGYQQQLISRTKQQEMEMREKLQQEIAEAETRARLLGNLKI
jgi:hypothetical protein